MGNHVSHGSGRVILPNGTVQEYTKPVTVAELMLDHPQQVVVEFQTLTNGRKPKPLPADMKLEANKIYMMLPMRRGKPVGAMSSEEARRLLLRANAVLNSKSFVSAYTGFLPLFARMCPASVIKSEKKENDETLAVMAKPGLLGEMESEGRADYYLSRQLSGKGSWKPSLDTIKEKGVKAKIRHWLR
ncbi:hypothetical protein L2E82_20223 [Cichorium intybus]|uniref:Uncharacterized protein n=1 Tax=Cichorium intybus TaxID=13427 RepID=A0ACB9DSE5_CICIN|nr:hypothetical protein L1887_21533 [Cichorium endivia]KAI3749609.1 hypothetical protein L2E82_20223 [Cichorium intybus]